MFLWTETFLILFLITKYVAVLDSNYTVWHKFEENLLSSKDVWSAKTSFISSFFYLHCLKSHTSKHELEAVISNQTVLSVYVPRLESPTRSLLMEAPKGIQILAEAGDIQAICRNELRLESKDGEVRQPTAQTNFMSIWRARTPLNQEDIG